MQNSDLIVLRLTYYLQFPFSYLSIVGVLLTSTIAGVYITKRNGCFIFYTYLYFNNTGVSHRICDAFAPENASLALQVSQ